jgi:hypothetical protein
MHACTLTFLEINNAWSIILICGLYLEDLAVFCHLIAFHDPELFIHLDETGFQPEVIN